jgi:hypothetical protein
MENLPRFGVSRADMMKRVDVFSELKGSDDGLPDSKMPGCIRTLFNVIGFQPPRDEGGSVTSPVGQDASRLAAIKISKGFNLGYCNAKPGNGPMLHHRHRVAISATRHRQHGITYSRSPDPMLPDRRHEWTSGWTFLLQSSFSLAVADRRRAA